jgi:hypothetical protein
MTPMTNAQDDTAYLSLTDYADTVGVDHRTVRRWLAADRLPGAVRESQGLSSRWWIPVDARVTPLPARERATPAAAPPRQSGAVAIVDSSPHVRADRFKVWYTVDDVVDAWAPLVSRHAVLAMVKDGTLEGMRHGPRGAMLITARSLRALAGDR